MEACMLWCFFFTGACGSLKHQEKCLSTGHPRPESAPGHCSSLPVRYVLTGRDRAGCHVSRKHEKYRGTVCSCDVAYKANSKKRMMPHMIRCWIQRTRWKRHCVRRRKVQSAESKVLVFHLLQAKP